MSASEAIAGAAYSWWRAGRSTRFGSAPPEHPAGEVIQEENCRATHCLFGIETDDDRGPRGAEGERRQLSVTAYSTDRRLPAGLGGRHHRAADWRCHEQ